MDIPVEYLSLEFPIEFFNHMHYGRSSRLEDMSDYGYFLKELLIKESQEKDSVFDGTFKAALSPVDSNVSKSEMQDLALKSKIKNKSNYAWTIRHQSSKYQNHQLIN